MTGLRAELHPFRLALKAPLVTGGVTIRFRAGFLVALSADGITGWGEASPLPGWSRTSLLDTEAALRRFCDDLARGGEAALNALLAAMRDTPHARAGAAGAWADLQARRAGRPLAEHLVADPARPVPPEVAVNALMAATRIGDSRSRRSGVIPALVRFAHGPLGPRPRPYEPGRSTYSLGPLAAPEPSEVEQAAHDAVEAGFQAAKLKVGAADPEVDAARIRAARAGLGPAAELRLDANGAWDEHTALNVLGRVHECGIAYCEEPVAGIEAIAAVGRRAPVPVAVDESMRSESDAVQALGLGISTLIVKPQALGGADIALSVADRAREAGASVVVTSFLDTAVGVAHALHVAAAADGAASPRRAHGLATSSLLASDVAEAPPVTAGVMSLPPGSGIGVVPAL